MEILKGRKLSPPRIVIIGDHGLGKSTFASHFPDPIAIDIEGGLDAIGVARTPKINNYLEFIAAMQMIKSTTPGTYRTLIIDSIDVLETLAQRDVAERAGVIDIADIPYGNGYKHATSLMFELLAQFDQLRESHKLAIILIGHVQIKKFNNPTGPDYDKFIMDMRDDTSRVVRDWCDVLGFVEQEKYITKEATSGKHKASSTGRSIINFKATAAYDAKSRYELSSPMPLEFSVFWAELIRAMRGEQVLKSE